MTTPSPALSDLHAFLTGAPTSRPVVWVAAGRRPAPDDLPEDALVIAAEELETAPGQELLLREGELDADCEQIVVDDALEISVMDYVLASYLPCTGPTLLRLAGDADWDAFLEDADDAVATGYVPDHLLSPLVLLEDAWPLASGDLPAGRCTLTADGASPCLPGAPSPLGRDTGGRPWLPRYLTLVAALRSVRTRDARDVVVSGLGARLGEHAPAELTEDARTAVILRTQDGYRCLLPDTGRFLSLPEQLALLLELVLTLGPDTETLAERTGLSPEQVRAAMSALEEAGILGQAALV